MSAIEVDELIVTYAGTPIDVYAVTGVSFDIAPGESLAIVGESGSGKSTLARAIGGLLPPNASIEFDRLIVADHELHATSGGGRGGHGRGRPPQGIERVLGSRLSYVFQEPKQYLNPSLKIGSQLREVLRKHAGLNRGSARARAIELLGEVGLGDDGRILGNYPHQISGGQAQRVAIAMAVATEPAVLILDEPTSALDVTVAARIIALLRRLQREHGMAVLHITHNLFLAARSCDRVAVMYAGEIVESGRAEDVLSSPLMPYTKALLDAVPAAAHDGQYVAPKPIMGAPPDMGHLEPGCRFRPRCEHATHQCGAPTQLVSSGARLVRCVRKTELHSIASGAGQ